MTTTDYTPLNPQYPLVNVQLTGEDGNAFLIIGRVQKAIRRAHGPEAANAFTNQATNCESYDQLLWFVQCTVDVT